MTVFVKKAHAEKEIVETELNKKSYYLGFT
jgi:hypothetical protein